MLISFSFQVCFVAYSLGFVLGTPEIGYGRSKGRRGEGFGHGDNGGELGERARVKEGVVIIIKDWYRGRV